MRARRMNVVLVDPSRTVLKIVGGLLEARDHKVCAFTDAQEALDCAKSDPTVEALITSAQLPSMPGVDLCRKARQLASRGRPIYVILMSSNQDGQSLIEALDNGADDFIGKPPVVEELYARLRAAERVGTMQRELLHLATTDPLTGILNRRAFFVQAEEACAHAQAGGLLSAGMFDIDHFKRVNDVHGHDAGDVAIRGIAREAATTANTILGRLGGEEFAFLLEGKGLTDAVEVAEDLRLRLSELHFETTTEEMTLTCSFGVSQWQPGDTIDGLLKRADVALYKAKLDGRNRVVAHEPPLAAINFAGPSPLAARLR
jgi:two-component system cell cycle response regulator